jgi:hypothetical protein
MNKVFEKGTWKIYEDKSVWTDVFSEPMYGVYILDATLPAYQGKNFKDCLMWLSNRNVISKEEYSKALEHKMESVLETAITEEEEEILSKKEPTPKDLVEEVLPSDEILFSIECRSCRKPFNMLTCRWDGEGNTICSHCGTTN